MMKILVTPFPSILWVPYPHFLATSPWISKSTLNLACPNWTLNGPLPPTWASSRIFYIIQWYHHFLFLHRNLRVILNISLSLLYWLYSFFHQNIISNIFQLLFPISISIITTFYPGYHLKHVNFRANPWRGWDPGQCMTVQSSSKILALEWRSFCIGIFHWLFEILLKTATSKLNCSDVG